MSEDTWQSLYEEMTTTPEKAVARIRPGQRIFVGTGCSHPERLTVALTARADELVDCEIVNLLAVGEPSYASRELASTFRVNSFFIAPAVRDLIQAGLGDYTPIYLSDIPRLIDSGRFPIDVALIQVSPPDDEGICSLGVSVDIVRNAIENASLVIAQVNPRMPRTRGESGVDILDLDVVVPVDEPICEMPDPEVPEAVAGIGAYIAALIDDESTIEFGIGAIPQAVIPYLEEKRNLGVHTEMFTDAIIGLIESGAVTGERKTSDRGKVVASFCMGTRRLYDYIDGNQRFRFMPTEYVNDPQRISQQHRMVAINNALEVDLTGQVCADSIGHRFYSGPGGQVDFNRGAARCPDGKAIIALPSTAKGGTVSRITCYLSPGAGVVTSRGDVHYVVTEYGSAYLHGKSVQERALSLIAIAHPDFRGQLVKDAIEANYLRPDYAAVEGKVLVGPPEFRSSKVLADGTKLDVRPMHPTDEASVKDLFYDLSRETVFYRFMSEKKYIKRKEVQDFVFVNHRDEVAIVATVPEAYGEDIVAIGRYYLDQTTNYAEVAFLVRDEWQNRGIGTTMLRHLTQIAKSNGIAGFTAEVLRQNRSMQSVLEKSEGEIQRKPEQEVVSYRIIFA